MGIDDILIGSLFVFSIGGAAAYVFYFHTLMPRLFEIRIECKRDLYKPAEAVECFVQITSKAPFAILIQQLKIWKAFSIERHESLTGSLGIRARENEFDPEILPVQLKLRPGETIVVPLKILTPERTDFISHLGGGDFVVRERLHLFFSGFDYRRIMFHNKESPHLALLIQADGGLLKSRAVANIRMDLSHLPNRLPEWIRYEEMHSTFFGRLSGKAAFIQKIGAEISSPPTELLLLARNDEEVMQLIRAGKRIAAIQAVQIKLGVDLPTATQLVCTISQQAPEN